MGTRGFSSYECRYMPVHPDVTGLQDIVDKERCAQLAATEDMPMYVSQDLSGGKGCTVRNLDSYNPYYEWNEISTRTAGSSVMYRAYPNCSIIS